MAYYNFKTDGSSGMAYYLGEYASGTQIDVAAKYTDYANLTSSNFIVQAKAQTASSSYYRKSHYFEEDRDSCEFSEAGSSSLSDVTISYDSSTGKLSFTQTLSQWSGAGIWGSTSEAQSSASANITAKVYLLPQIEEL